MVKKFFVLLLISVMILGVGFLPEIILGTMPRVTVVIPQVKEYTPTVKCNGTVKTVRSYELLSSGLYEIVTIYVESGTMVSRGEPLALLRSAEDAPFFVRQVREGQESSNLDQLAGLASKYGMSAAELTKMTQTTQGQEAIELLTESAEEVTVTSPISGVVLDDLPEEGTVVTQGISLCKIQDRSSFLVTAQISERDIEKVSVGNTAVITGQGLGKTSCSGVVERISTTAEKVLNGTAYETVVTADIRITDFPENLRPGYDVKVTITTGEERQMVLLPYEAVGQDSSNQEFVWISKNGNVEQRKIITGLELAEGIEILEGINPGEAIAVMGTGVGEKAPKLFLVKEE